MNLFQVSIPVEGTVWRISTTSAFWIYLYPIVSPWYGVYVHKLWLFIVTIFDPPQIIKFYFCSLSAVKIKHLSWKAERKKYMYDFDK